MSAFLPDQKLIVRLNARIASQREEIAHLHFALRQAKLAALRFNPSRILCVFNHDWYLIANITGRSRHVGCHRCGRQWGMNDDARGLLPWAVVSEFHAETHGYRP